VPLDVLDGGRVARRPRGPRAAVLGGDPLQRAEVNRRVRDQPRRGRGRRLRVARRVASVGEDDRDQEGDDEREREERPARHEDQHARPASSGHKEHTARDREYDRREMRAGKVIAILVTIMLGAPVAAGAQDRTDERVRQDAAGLPEHLWEPGSDPVSAAGPALPEDDGGGVTLLLAVALLAVAVSAGYAVSLLRPAAVPEAAPPPPPPHPEPEPEPQPLPAGHDAEVERQTCVIALSHAWGRGRFDVRVKDRGAAHRVVASSLGFEVPPGMTVREGGAACRAHRRLLLHLAAAGWELEPHSGGPWYERRLSRPVEREVDRALVTTRPDGREAEFVALALDDFGNARVMARSPRFARRAGRGVEETQTAVAAHGTLLEDLEAHGWRVSGTLEGWYGATLARRRGG
jgi:hypothetical protein